MTSIRLGYVMWPEGEPDKAVWLPRFSLLRDWLMAFGWSLRAKRTCRLRPVRKYENAIRLAWKCDKYGKIR